MVMNSDETLPQTSSLFRTYHSYLEQQKELKKPLMYYKMQVGDVIQSLGEKFLKSAPAYTVKEINWTIPAFRTILSKSGDYFTQNLLCRNALGVLFIRAYFSKRLKFKTNIFILYRNLDSTFW